MKTRSFVYIDFPSFPLYMWHRLQSYFYTNIFNVLRSILRHWSYLGIKWLFLETLLFSQSWRLCPNSYLEVAHDHAHPKWHLRIICKPVCQNRGKTTTKIYQHDNQVLVPGIFSCLISPSLCSLNFKQPVSGPHSPTKTRLIPKMWV